jgi:tripartite-type tricarboxylate transporter receptor subunit TctC
MKTLALALGLMAAAPAAAADGDAYPTKPITAVVPFAAGSTTDIFARHLSERIKAYVSQPLIVENQPGANGVIGVNEAKSRNADGYTILLGTITTQVANYSLFKSVPYKPSDFKGIACLYTAPPMVAIRSTLPIKTVAELVDYAKNNPGKLTYGWSNSTNRIGGALLSSRTGTGIRSVPYKGSPQIMSDMLGERVDIYVDSPPTIIPHVKDGNMRVLATLAPQRAEALPDVPTLAELGYSNATMNPWVGAFVRAETPEKTTKAISALFDKLTASSEMKEDLRKIGQQPWRCTPEEMDQTVRTDIPVWESLIISAGIEKQ